jgi:hypothetical protein
VWSRGKIKYPKLSERLFLACRGPKFELEKQECVLPVSRSFD